MLLGWKNESLYLVSRLSSGGGIRIVSHMREDVNRVCDSYLRLSLHVMVLTDIV